MRTLGKYYPEIFEWLEKRGILYSIHQLSPSFISIKFPVSEVPEDVVKEFKDFVRKSIKVQKIEDVFTIGNHYVDIIPKVEYVIEPPLPSVNIKKLVEHISIKKGRICISTKFKAPKGFKKYVIYEVYGGKYKVFRKEIYLKMGRKYLYCVSRLPPSEWSLYVKIPLDELR